ncbi:MAG: hypothetical protein WBP72_17905, partial [Rhodocyclaceae bacterium]
FESGSGTDTGDAFRHMKDLGRQARLANVIVVTIATLNPFRPRMCRLEAGMSMAKTTRDQTVVGK